VMMLSFIVPLSTLVISISPLQFDLDRAAKPQWQERQTSCRESY